MKKNNTVTKQGLVELLQKCGFKESATSSQTTRIMKHETEKGRHTICFLFPESSDDPTKNAGFAGIGASNKGNAIPGTNFEIRYNNMTYGELQQKMRNKLGYLIGEHI